MNPYDPPAEDSTKKQPSRSWDWLSGVMFWFLVGLTFLFAIFVLRMFVASMGA